MDFTTFLLGAFIVALSAVGLVKVCIRRLQRGVNVQFTDECVDTVASSHADDVEDPEDIGELFEVIRKYLANSTKG